MDERTTRMAHEALCAMLVNPDPRHLFGMIAIKPTVDQVVRLSWEIAEMMEREEQRWLSDVSAGGGSPGQSDPPTGR